MPINMISCVNKDYVCMHVCMCVCVCVRVRVRALCQKFRQPMCQNGSSEAATSVINMRGCALHLFVQKCARKISLLES